MSRLMVGRMLCRKAPRHLGDDLPDVVPSVVELGWVDRRLCDPLLLRFCRGDWGIGVMPGSALDQETRAEGVE